MDLERALRLLLLLISFEAGLSDEGALYNFKSNCSYIHHKLLYSWSPENPVRKRSGKEVF